MVQRQAQSGISRGSSAIPGYVVVSFQEPRQCSVVRDADLERRDTPAGPDEQPSEASPPVPFRQPAEDTSPVEELADSPALLDEERSEAPKKRKSRGPMSAEHKQALMAGRERARAAREQAERERADSDQLVVDTVVVLDTPAEDTWIVLGSAAADDPPRPATVD